MLFGLIDQKGVRVFEFMNDPLTTVENLITTTKLFIPMSTKHVPDKVAALNVDFVESYTDFRYPPREESDNTYIPEHKVFFTILSYFILK